MICKQSGTVLEFCIVLCYTVDEGKVIVWRERQEVQRRMAFTMSNRVVQTKDVYLNPIQIE